MRSTLDGSAQIVSSEAESEAPRPRASPHGRKTGLEYRMIRKYYEPTNIVAADRRARRAGAAMAPVSSAERPDLEAKREIAHEFEVARAVSLEAITSSITASQSPLMAISD